MGGIRFIITKKGKKLISMIVVAFLVTILLSTIIFASIGSPLKSDKIDDEQSTPLEILNRVRNVSR